MSKFESWLRKNMFLLVVVILVMVMRIPSLLEPNWYGDEGIYLVLGQALRNGLIWYREIHDNKPPMLYLLAALTGSVAYFRLLLLIWMAATMLVLGKLVDSLKIGGWRKKIAVVFFAVFTTIPLIEGHIANAEIFMILPTLLGVLMALKGKPLFNLASGVMFGLAVLFKMPALFEFAGIVLYFFLTDKKRWSRVLMMSIGFFLPVAISVGYYFAVGAGTDYLSAAFLQNIGYLSSWRTGSINNSGVGAQSGLAVRGVILLGLLGWSYLVTRKYSLNFRLVCFWFLFALFGALLSERPYPHYLLQMVTPLALLVAQMGWKDRAKSGVVLVCVVLLAMAIMKYRFYFYDPIGYYQHFVGLMAGSESTESWAKYFDKKVARTTKLAKYIRENTQPNERILVWADEPFVYLESDRLPITKYIVAYHVLDFGAKDLVMNRMKNNPPRIIVWPTTEKRDFSELSAVLDRDYALAARFEDARVYLLINKGSEK